MNIISLIKPTPSGPAASEWTIGSLDLYALSHALDLRDRVGGSVHAIVVGPASSAPVAQRALASGADEGTLLVFEQPELLDAAALSVLLKEHVSGMDHDLILSGQTSDDLETGLLGPMLAEQLGLPHVSTVTRIDSDDGQLRIERDVVGGKHVLQVTLPALLAVLSGREISLRFPTPRGMIAARKKPMHTIHIDTGIPGSGVSWTHPTVPERSGDGELLRDLSAGDAAVAIASWLRQRGLTG
ncbi:MAG: hypothetical protein WKF81_06600 [Thermomicrobiales bacterium]